MKDLYYSGDDYVYFFIKNTTSFVMIFLTVYYYFNTPCNMFLR